MIRLPALIFAVAAAVLAFQSQTQAQVLAQNKPECDFLRMLKNECNPRAEAKKKQQKKTGSSTSSKAKKKSTPAKPKEPKKDPWIYTAKADPDPIADALIVPNQKRLMILRARQRETDAFSNPEVRSKARFRSYPQKPWNNLIPIFQDPSIGIMTSGYGWRNNRGRDFHGGIDIKAPAKTPVLSPVSGEILTLSKSGTQSGIVVQSGSVQHVFWHTRPLKDLKKGDRVASGQTLGRLVSWGSQTHLHYAIHITGKVNERVKWTDENSIDPLIIMSECCNFRPETALENEWYQSVSWPYHHQQANTEDQIQPQTQPIAGFGLESLLSEPLP